MKTTKLQTIKKMGLILLFSVIACLVMVVCNTTKSYASAIQYDFDHSQIDYDFDHCQVEEIYQEYLSDVWTWGVENNQHNIVHVYNLRNDDGTTSNFDFEYDYRGSEGNDTALELEGDQIQCFYNSETRELAIIRVGWNSGAHSASHWNGTYNHAVTHHTILEQEQHYNDKPVSSITIGDYVKHVYIDPTIDYIGSYSLINLHMCESVDMINHCYKSSTLGDPGTRYECDEKKVNCFRTDAFEYIGNYHGNVPVELPFLHLFNSAHRKDVLDNYKHRGFDDSNIVFHEGLYENHFNITKSTEIETVTDMNGAAVPKTLRCPANSKYYTIKMKVKDGFVPVVNDSFKNIPVAYNEELHEYTCVLDIEHYNSHNIKITTEVHEDIALTGMVWRDGERVYDVKVDLMDTNGNVIRSSYPGPFGYCFWVKNGFSGKIYVRDNTSSACVIINNAQDNVQNNLELGKGFSLSGTISKLVGEDKQQTIVKAAGVHLDLIDDNNQVIGKAVTDSEGHYSVKVKAGASFKVHVYCSDPKVSGKIIMDDDKVYDVLFRGW